MPTDVDVSIDPAVRAWAARSGLFARLALACLQRACMLRALAAVLNRLPVATAAASPYTPGCLALPLLPAVTSVRPLPLLLLRRSWRGWTMPCCATCTKCGWRSSARRRAARTSQVGRRWPCLCLLVGVDRVRPSWFGSPLKALRRCPLPPPPSRRHGGGQGGIAEAQSGREGGQGQQKIQVLKTEGLLRCPACVRRSHLAECPANPKVLPTCGHVGWRGAAPDACVR